MSWVAVAVTVVSTAATMYNQRQTQRRQDNQLAAQLRDQREKQQAADQRTAELIRQQSQSSDEDERSSSLERFTEAIQANRGKAAAPLQTQGAVSAAYKKAGSDAALGMTDYAGRVAGLLSSMDAPIQQRQNDEFIKGRYATDIGLIGRQTSGDDYLHEMRLRNIRPNPWINAAASLGSAYGQAYAGSGNTTGGG